MIDKTSEKRVPDIFGENVFNDSVMRERLPKSIYKALKATIDESAPLDPSIASIVANAMKDWAIEKGATHYCHWFQPMTGVTAEKHDSFISPTIDGHTIMEFSGKELVQSEPDASSFPSGGLRATFEARGYTAWDCTSPVFIRSNGSGKTLYIPSAYCSYTSEALDKKTPLLRSMDALNRNSMRILRVLGNTTTRRVIPTLGPEQEYFLVDKNFADKRLDLLLTGRTLFGAPPPKGQEMADHYFGTLHERIANFMHELNMELWHLGVSAKTQHNEVSPAQYELAPIYGTVNVATDHNQITMDTMHKVALHHDFVCLLHEKPFAGVNGSGKHCNWSLLTDDGMNLLDPGKTPHENQQFLLFLSAMIKAVDKYSGLLRASVATYGNDHRLGTNEAPPAIISVFLGDQLTDIFDQLANGGATESKQGGDLRLGVSTIPKLPKDSTDRNRTSPFAFTGNKFEFRMVGSTQSTAGPCYILNTMVADVLGEIADSLEDTDNVNEKIQEILRDIAVNHNRIIFNGDNYSYDWVVEAEERGLPNVMNAADSLKALIDPEVTSLFERHGVLTKHEMHARYEILLERYTKAINIEALTTIDIARRQILPAAMEYSGILADAALKLKNIGITPDVHTSELKKLYNLIGWLGDDITTLEAKIEKSSNISDTFEQSCAYRDMVIPAMESVRNDVDSLELIVDPLIWPLPSYADMLFKR